MASYGLFLHYFLMSLEDCSWFQVLNLLLANAVQRGVFENEGDHHMAEITPRPIKKIPKMLGVAKSTIWYILKRRNTLLSSATPKGMEDHWRKLKWIIINFFSWFKTTTTRKHTPSQHLPGKQTFWGGRSINAKVYNQKMPLWM